MSQPAVVIVSPYFPPSTLAGVHRARHLAKHLSSQGWRPIVLCVDESFHEQALDPGLARLLPEGLDIRKVGAIPALLTRRFGVGDISVRAWFPLRRKLLELAAHEDVRAVLFTGSPFYPMTLAPLLKRRFGLPVILDFQDPWVSAWGARQPKLSKAGIVHAIAKRLEGRAMRGAAHITSVSERQNEELADRHPWLDRQAMSAIPIGADPEDFALLRKRPHDPEPDAFGGEPFTIAYVGTIWPEVFPTLDTLLEAVAQLRDERPEIFRRLRLQFIGTTSNPSDTSGYLVRPRAEKFGVSAVVEEVPQRVPYLSALELTAKAGANLILGSDEPHYTASKVFGLLMAGRPHLSLMRVESSAHQICNAAGGGVALHFSSAAQLPDLVRPLADAISQLVMGQQDLGQIDPAIYASFHAGEISKQFAQILNQVAI